MQQGIHLILASLCGTVVSSIATTSGGYRPPQVFQFISSSVPITEKKKSNNKFLGSFHPRSSMPTAELEVDSLNGPIISRDQREIALNETVQAFTAAGVKFVLSAGGALGIIRDGRLPDKDDDIDFFVTHDTFQLARNVLLNMKTSNGQKPFPFVSKPYGQTMDQVAEFIKFKAKGWGPVEIWRIDEPKQTTDADVLCLPHFRTVIPKSMFFPPKLVQTKLGFMVPIPNGQERFAEYYYGVGWRVPSLEKSNKLKNCGGGPQELHDTFFKSCPIGHTISKVFNPMTGRMRVKPYHYWWDPVKRQVTC